jgi:hypothetical protein
MAYGNPNGLVSVPAIGPATPTNITLKNIPDDLYYLLKRSAEANQRSLNGEVVACLYRALPVASAASPELVERIHRHRDQYKGRPLSQREIGEAIRTGRR